MDRTRPFGDRLRDWRQRRHLSQLDLAAQVEISTRHLSFVETGRSQPSRAMVLRLAEQLNVPLRERNALLVAAGYAHILARVARDLELVLEAFYPADEHTAKVLRDLAATIR